MAKGKLFEKVQHKATGIEFEIRFYASESQFRTFLPNGLGSLNNTDPVILKKTALDLIEKNVSVDWMQIIHVQFERNSTVLHIETGWVSRRSETHITFVSERHVREGSKMEHTTQQLLTMPLKERSRFSGLNNSTFNVPPENIYGAAWGQLVPINAMNFYRNNRAYIVLYDEVTLMKLERLQAMMAMVSKQMNYFFAIDTKELEAAPIVTDNLRMLQEESTISFVDGGIAWVSQPEANFHETVIAVPNTILQSVFIGLISYYDREIKGENLSADGLMELAQDLSRAGVGWTMDCECPECGGTVVTLNTDNTPKCLSCDTEFDAGFNSDFCDDEDEEEDKDE